MIKILPIQRNNTNKLNLTNKNNTSFSGGTLAGTVLQNQPQSNWGKLWKNIQKFCAFVEKAFCWFNG